MASIHQHLDFDCSICNEPLIVFPNSSGYRIMPCDSCNELEHSMGYNHGYREGFSHGADEE